MTRTAQDVEQTVRAHNEIWNERDYSKVSDVISESFVEYNPVVPDGELHGRDEMEEWVREVTSAFPDIQAKILDLIVNDGTAMIEVEFTMTHEGEFMGIEPTGRKVAFRGMGKFDINDGEVTELRNYLNPQTIFEQLGVIDREPGVQENRSQTATTGEENARLAREHFDRVWNHGEFDTDDLADDFRVKTRLGTHEEHTLEEYQSLVDSARDGVPDLHKEIDETIATPEKVVLRYTMTGTQEGEFKGIPPTGEEIEIAGVAIYRIDDGTLSEAWIISNFLRAFKQLGVVD